MDILTRKESESYLSRKGNCGVGNYGLDWTFSLLRNVSDRLVLKFRRKWTGNPGLEIHKFSVFERKSCECHASVRGRRAFDS